ncbi:MAG: RNA polymerase subunit sigma [Bacillota bacterium]|uniref:RNA polymerase sigma factor n=1 Tax=Candidatus Gallimonas intestinavium TaxID=2838603 RepID=A0A9D2JY56_9FIRM|nr:MAG: RNA polymerase subunit sigma [Bacillota bacterium]HIZ71960.1 RNA polymerase sigma factor [Candidatus Gallimonas intestinavium]
MKDLERFYEENYPRLYAYCVTLTRNRADAEDLAAETMYRAIRHADKFRGDCPVGVWLCSIARNFFLTQEKKRKRPPPLPDPPEDLFAGDEKEDVKEIILHMNALEEPYRGVFLLRTIGKAEYGEIAKIYEKSESWARVTYHRARLKIIEKMGGTKT